MQIAMGFLPVINPKSRLQSAKQKTGYQANKCFIKILEILITAQATKIGSSELSKCCFLLFSFFFFRKQNFRQTDARLLILGCSFLDNNCTINIIPKIVTHHEHESKLEITA